MTLSAAVIVLETSSNLTYAPPVAIACLIAKATGDLLGHGLYDAHLRLQRIAFLGDSLPDGLRHLRAGDVASAPVVCVSEVASARALLLALRVRALPLPIAASLTSQGTCLTSQRRGPAARAGLHAQRLPGHLLSGPGQRAQVFGRDHARAAAGAAQAQGLPRRAGRRRRGQACGWRRRQLQPATFGGGQQLLLRRAGGAGRGGGARGCGRRRAELPGCWACRQARASSLLLRGERAGRVGQAAQRDGQAAERDERLWGRLPVVARGRRARRLGVERGAGRRAARAAEISLEAPHGSERGSGVRRPRPACQRGPQGSGLCS